MTAATPTETDTTANDSTTPSITLLFPNATRSEVIISEISTQGSSTTVNDLNKHILTLDQDKLWSSDPASAPSDTAQIRLIHMGRPLTSQTVLRSLKLDVSPVIHVSVKPVDVAKGTSSHHDVDGDDVDRGKCCVIC